MHIPVNYRNVSRLHFAGQLTNLRITCMFEQTKEFKETIAKLMTEASSVDLLNCDCYVDAAHEPMLRAVFVQLFRYYSITTASEKAAIREYFKFEDDASLKGTLARGEMNGTNCMATWQELDICEMKSLRYVAS